MNYLRDYRFADAMRKIMGLGDFMRDKLVVQDPVISRGVTMGVNETFRDGREIMGFVQDLSTREQFQYRSVGTLVSHEIFFNRDPKITNANRLRFGQQVYKVVGVISEGSPGKRVLWRVTAEELSTRGVSQ